jgi:hypothetical protein
MTVVQDGLGMKRDPIQKTPKTKKTGGVTQVAGHLSSKHEALSSNHSTTKKIKFLKNSFP